MIPLRTALQRATGTASLLCVLSLLPAAYAAPITDGFALVNTDADGSIATPSVLFPGDALSFDLTGGNTGTGLAGQTQFIGTAPTAGIVQFLWSYTSCYPPNEQPPSLACDTPGGDFAGYVVDDILTQLTDTDTGGVAAPASFMVNAGSVFGWYVSTFDNTGEPGTLTVSDISFAASTAEIPEPGTISVCLAGLLALVAARRIKT